jgi:tetraacyldisaccharide 4'-kinase
LGLLSAIYKLGLSCHQSLVSPKKLPEKVISVGNLTLGGTGKTPAVISLAREAKKRGFSPCILTRGYKGTSKDTCFVSRGDGPLISASEAGDEALLMAELLRGVPVIKGCNRYASGLLAMREYFKKQDLLTPLFILDDGFQHWALARDINIVLIDATNPFGNGRLLPEGPLREPLEGLNRADIIVLTKSDIPAKESVSDTIEKVKRYNSRAPVFSASHRPLDLITVNGDVKSLDFLAKKKIYAFAAIANTLSFESVLRAHGAEIVQFRNYRDHYSYKQKDMDDIQHDALGLDIITTEKDLVKLRDLHVPENVFALRIEFSVAEDFYTDLFRRLQ